MVGNKIVQNGPITVLKLVPITSLLFPTIHSRIGSRERKNSTLFSMARCMVVYSRWTNSLCIALPMKTTWDFPPQAFPMTWNRARVVILLHCWGTLRVFFLQRCSYSLEWNNAIRTEFRILPQFLHGVCITWPVIVKWSNVNVCSKSKAIVMVRVRVTRSDWSWEALSEAPGVDWSLWSLFTGSEKNHLSCTHRSVCCV